MREFGYLLRRELWEHRSLYVVPLVVAALILLGAAFGRLRIDVEAIEVVTFARYSLVGFVALFLVVMLIVTLFYLLDALYAERRDRSILFWKSMPVSDTSTVLSKFAVSMLVVPAIVFAAALLTLLGALLIASVRGAISGTPLGLWSQVEFAETSLISLYGLAVQVLWYAPLYAYLLLVSAWAGRAVFLWATLTPLGIIIAENQVFDTGYFAEVVGNRLVGVFQEHIVRGEHGHREPMSLTELVDPAPFLMDPGFYLGIAAAAAMLGATIWLRRYREEG